MRTITHSLMVHTRVSEAHINFVLMYTADHIFLVLLLKELINKDSNPNTPFKLATSMKTSISHLHVLFCPCVAQKATSHVDKKAFNMCHQSQKGFYGIFVAIPQYQK